MVLFLDFQPSPRGQDLLLLFFPACQLLLSGRLYTTSFSSIPSNSWVFELEHAGMIKQGFDYTLAGYSSVRTSALQYHADRRFNQQTNRSGAWIQQDLRYQQSHYPRAGRLKELHDHTVGEVKILVCGPMSFIQTSAWPSETSPFSPSLDVVIDLAILSRLGFASFLQLAGESKSEQHVERLGVRYLQYHIAPFSGRGRLFGMEVVVSANESSC
ncbi:hypothetical protein NA56DRAFT_704547 [Hyaloscypha hepaticicola]|uniref:Uncharacterized protein n=1 Tax=Hyaloscypha hepaticicola TaxID=2082293 RepID=A0A2J6Q1R9_9HELO|nr:hypothetical protein NA56DRAFT_704547 [Hyaloscypha hepaticicola]